MKAEVRISIKDYRRNKNVKILLLRPTSSLPAVHGVDEWGAVAYEWPTGVSMGGQKIFLQPGALLCARVRLVRRKPEGGVETGC